MPTRDDQQQEQKEKSMLKKYLLFPLLIAAISATTVMVLYQQAPGVTLNPDSQTYLDVVATMTAHHLSLSSLINPVRLPGYPLFLFLLHSNLLIATRVQLLLFVVVAILAYWIALLAFDIPWIALFCGLLVASNPTLAGYFKPIMSEALACFFLSLLSLLCILHLRSSRLLWLLGAGLLLLLLIFTRPEWIALPLLIFPVLLLGTAIQKNRKKFLPSLLVAVILAGCIYSSIGLYIQANGKQNGYHGFSAIQNMNQLGKILQYRMEDEAPPSERIHTARLKMCITTLGTRDPWPLLSCSRDLASPFAQPAGRYAWSVIISHPVEFLEKSFPLFFLYLTAYFDPSPSQNHAIPLFSVLTFLHRTLYELNILFPLLVIWPIWLLYQIGRRKEATYTSWTMTLLWGIASYGNLLVGLASYTDADSMRFHTVFGPLISILIWGTFFSFSLSQATKMYEEWRRNNARATRTREEGAASGANGA